MSIVVERSEIGLVKLDDGTELTVRVSILRVEEEPVPDAKILKVLPPKINVKFNVSIHTCSSPQLKEKVKDKQILRSTVTLEQVLGEIDDWDYIRILHVEPARETVIFETPISKRKYRITIEVFPYWVIRTLKYRDVEGNPIYLVLWQLCLTRLEPCDIMPRCTT